MQSGWVDGVVQCLLSLPGRCLGKLGKALYITHGISTATATTFTNWGNSVKNLYFSIGHSQA